MQNCSREYDKYFEMMEKKMQAEYKIAKDARRKGLDPSDDVESSLVKTMPEKVMGLIATVAPQIKNSNLTKRFEELEKIYGVLDWRVAMKVAEEIAKQQICKFETAVEAMEVGIRAGFAYITLGLVSAALEGFTKLEIKKRRDGRGEYFCLHFSGPIRNAGGTAASVCVIIADYVRVVMGYDTYDPDSQEVQRFFSEVEHYNERCVRIQYMPLKEELDFLAVRLPVEISGDPTEKIEVPNFKNLSRIPTNLIRSGMCLIMSSCIPLKAPKLWKEISVWSAEFNMQHWSFLEEFIKVQKSARARQQGTSKKEEPEIQAKIKPNYSYIADAMGGRPILAHPLAKGGLRLRYGRSRISGLSGQSIHPATMHVLNDFIAVGTQLKVERPGKASVYSPCDTIDGPIVKLQNDSVVRLETERDALRVKKEIKEILFMGDVLVCYGDFFDRAHPLVPAGYCEEWWVQELEKSIVNSFGSLDIDKTSDLTKINSERIKNILEKPLYIKPTQEEAVRLSAILAVPLHPRYTFHWKDISMDDFSVLIEWLRKANVQVSDTVEKIIIFNEERPKRVLEILGVPHIVSVDYVVIEKEFALAFFKQLAEFDFELLLSQTAENPLEIINKFSGIRVRDKSGTYIGCRMGRPEKAKMRSMKGNPHGLFPIGGEGGRMRSFQSALSGGIVTSSFPIFICSNCGNETIYPKCEACNHKTKKMNYCQKCGIVEKCEHNYQGGRERAIDFKKYFEIALRNLGSNLYPDLIKGIRGAINNEKYIENMIKPVLRAKHGVCVNKDGTVRYDCIEIACTHFKPSEIGITVEDAHNLGYFMDAFGKPLETDEQICELKVQDIIIPCCQEIEYPADKVLLKITKFIDELLETFYGMPAYYNCNTRKDLLGHLLVGLAPHTSAGTALRIIGFSKTQGLIAHPMFHCAIRRDADGDEGGLFMLLDCLLNFSQKFLPGTRGSTMDAPIVLSSCIDPAGVDDMLFKMDTVWKYPLELYEAAEEYKMPWTVKIEQVLHRLGRPEQYEGYGFTHDNGNMNSGVLVSSYKTLPTMDDKVLAQMDLAEKLRAADTVDVATMVINKHFLKDIMGNLRKFSQQIFRCIKCNEKFRRVPLIGICTKCGGKIVLTVSEGSVIKYLETSLKMAEKYKIAQYYKHSLDIVKIKIESTFGKDKEKQEGLGRWV